jgi:lysophospholipase L1-like esterase
MDMPTHDRRAYRKAIGFFPERPRIISEGDSWFSYPLSINIARRLNLIEPRCNWLRLEANGDEALDLIQSAALDDRAVQARIGHQERRLTNLLRDPVTRPGALLLSAGGNDIIGEGMADYLVPFDEFRQSGGRPEDAINATTFERKLAAIERAYRRIVRIRDSTAPRRGGTTTLIITHCYSAPQPRKVSLRILTMAIGPWMHPAFKQRGYPNEPGALGSALMLEIVRVMLARFEALLRGLENDPTVEHFKVARTAGLLTPAPPMAPATGGDWHDEIHPSDAGYEKVARAFVPHLQRRFPGFFAAGE